MQIKSKQCSPSDHNKEQFVFSKNCARFNYNLDSDSFDNLWAIKDDVKTIEKMPSKWRENKDLELKFAKGIVQEADLKTSNGAIATWIELKHKNVCNDGNFTSMFKVEGEGRLAFMFRKENENVFW